MTARPRTVGIHPKATGAGAAGVVVTFIVACLAWAGIDVPLTVASAATALGALAGAYLAPAGRAPRTDGGHVSLPLAWAVTLALLGLIWLTLLFRWHLHTS